MKIRLSSRSAVPLVLTFAALAVVLPAGPARADWRQWRGPRADGTAPGATPPLEWSETKNVKWKVRIPGSGSSTPIILGDRIFLTTAVPADKNSQTAPSVPEAPPAAPSGAPSSAAEGQGTPPASALPPPPEAAPAPRGGTGTPEGGRRGGRRGGGDGGPRRADGPEAEHLFQLICLDRATGKTLWTRTAVEVQPHEGHHQDHGFASHSPVTDGEHVYAYFGSRGLHCYTLDGKPVWSKQLGRMRTRNAFGEGSSPLLTGDAIVVNWDHEDSDFIAVFDKKTGAERWRKERDEPTSWATPLAVEHGGKTQIIVSATNRIRSYDLADGTVLWECGGMTTNVIPSPVYGEGLVYALSGFRGNSIKAIRLGGSGDLTDTDSVVWSQDSKAPYVPSGLLEGGRLWYFSQNTGILSCADAQTGELLIDAARIEGLGGVYASPVAASGRVYLTGRNGEGVVLKAGPKLEVLATSRLEEKFDASPALSGKDMLLRGHQHLYCLAEQP